MRDGTIQDKMGRRFGAAWVDFSKMSRRWKHVSVWEATKAINGGRSSLKDFNNFVGGKLRERGYVPLQTDSQMFYNKVTGVVFHVHVDDPWAVGKATEL